MRRSLGGAAALLMVSSLASACAGQGPGVALTLTLFGDPVEVAGYQELVDAFEDANPGIDVTLSPVPDQTDLLVRLTTAFRAGDPPDVFLINYRSYGGFAEQGVLAPVQPFVDDSGVIDLADYAPAALNAFRFDGDELTCFPQNVSSLAVYYNADLFRARGVPPPRTGWTWDDFLAAAQQLTGDGVYGVGIEPSLIRLAPFVWSNGGEVVDDLDDPTMLTLDTGAAREAVDFFLDLQTEHGVVPPDREERAQTSESRFLAGRLAMFLDSRKAVPTLRTIDDFSWDVAALPVAPGGEPATILHGDAYCLAADSPELDAGWRLVEYANSAAGQRILAASGRTVPSRLDVARSPAFLDPDQPPAAADVFVEQIPNVRAVPHTSTWSPTEQQADEVLAELFYGRVEREAGIRELMERTEPLLEP
ncbi:MAG: sugar ABC transporter substrate-binding protein [Actinomycetota bacterium]|nr:sugar ABC transporter substrate-binding protein [Actinomycetota bacterium]